MKIENPMVSGLSSYYSAQDGRSAMADEAYDTLRDELTYALLHDPAKLVQTPGFNPRMTSAADVVADSFASATGDASLHELLRIVGLCAQGKAAELQKRAASWIAGRAAQHAAFHQGDLVADLEGQ